MKVRRGGSNKLTYTVHTNTSLIMFAFPFLQIAANNAVKRALATATKTVAKGAAAKKANSETAGEQDTCM